MNRYFCAGLLAVVTAFFASTAFSSEVLRVEGAPVTSTKAEATVSWRAAPSAGNTTAVTFTPLSATALKAVQEENSQESGSLQTKRLKIGVNRNADTETDANTPFTLNWQNNGDGYVARWAVTSPGARGMRVGLRIRALPDSTELRFSGSAAPEKIIGIVSGQEAKALRSDDNVYWTPVTEGETQNIEIYLPSPVKPENVKIRLNAASHLFTSARDGFSAAPVVKASQFCEVDVACKFDSLGVAFQNASKAVANMVFSDSSGSHSCSGTLLNNNSGSQTPYFWSAAHCISTQSSANTLNTLWFYEHASCNDFQQNPNYRQLTGGARLLYTKTSTDTSFFLLNDPVPAGAYLAGWDADRFSSGPFIGIHHPAGDYKKVSVGNGEGRTCDTFFRPDPDIDLSTLSLVSWSEGYTEPGSSGSGLFTLSNGAYYLRGGLMGGTGSCLFSGFPVDSGNADCYSSLNLVYDAVKQWLAPDVTPVPPTPPTPPPPSQFGPTRQYTGQWYRQGENNWGLTVLMNFPGNARYIFVPWYTYDSSGKASWYIFEGDTWSANDKITLDVYRFTGPNWGTTPYDNNRVTYSKVGTATLAFTSATAATFSYTVENASRTITLTKLE